MDKKSMKIFGVAMLCVIIASAAIVINFKISHANDYEGSIAQLTAVNQTSEPAASSSSAPAAQYSLPPIKAPVKDVIAEPPAAKPEDSLPPADVTESKDENGDKVQTPNWDAQKELKPGTDLGDESSKPQYKYESSSSAPSSSTPSGSTPSGGGSGSSSSPSTPKDGDTKVINGETYTYWPPFGWVKNGDGGTTERVEVELSGNKVGH